MQQVMERRAGIYRDEAGLQEAAVQVGKQRVRFADIRVGDKDRVFNTELTAVLELDFMLDVAAAIAHAALARQESRGAHSRTDFPTRDDGRFLTHSLVSRTDGAPRIDYAPVAITRWQPAARVY